MERTLKRIYKGLYQNYQYHKEPKLDITEVPAILWGSCQIVSCSEVLEHVAPPIDLAFIGLRKLLTENGKLILSVPHSDSSGKHVEHFPQMKNTQIFLYDKPILIGYLENGECIQFDDLIFHGGVGSTLEYRIFSESSLSNSLKRAGFKNLQQNRNHKLLGIYWEPWSRVWLAQL